MQRVIQKIRRHWLAGLIVVAGVSSFSGCIAAAAAGAGGAIYLTDRGAESLVTTSVNETFAAAEATFKELGISETKRVTEGDSERQLEGKEGDRDLTVKMKRENESTKVEVTARTSAVTWDKDYAKLVLEKIVGRTSSGS